MVGVGGVVTEIGEVGYSRSSVLKIGRLQRSMRSNGARPRGRVRDMVLKKGASTSNVAKGEEEERKAESFGRPNFATLFLCRAAFQCDSRAAAQ